MNCTVVDLVAAEPVGRDELAHLGLHLVLQCLQPSELVHPPGQPLEVRDDQRAVPVQQLLCEIRERGYTGSMNLLYR